MEGSRVVPCDVSVFLWESPLTQGQTTLPLTLRKIDFCLSLSHLQENSGPLCQHIADNPHFRHFTILCKGAILMFFLITSFLKGAQETHFTYSIAGWEHAALFNCITEWVKTCKN